jgi:hypothetical protein
LSKNAVATGRPPSGRPEPWWRGFLRRELMVSLAVAVLLLLTIGFYALEASKPVKTLYVFPK